MNDKELRQLVMDELEFEPSIDSAGIGVSAEHGVVTLNGVTETPTARVRAEKLAAANRGVREVRNHLTVKQG